MLSVQHAALGVPNSPFQGLSEYTPHTPTSGWGRKSAISGESGMIMLSDTLNVQAPGTNLAGNSPKGKSSPLLFSLSATTPAHGVFCWVSYWKPGHCTMEGGMGDLVCGSGLPYCSVDLCPAPTWHPAAGRHLKLLETWTLHRGRGHGGGGWCVGRGCPTVWTCVQRPHGIQLQGDTSNLGTECDDKSTDPVPCIKTCTSPA